MINTDDIKSFSYQAEVCSLSPDNLNDKLLKWAMLSLYPARMRLVIIFKS